MGISNYTDEQQIAIEKQNVNMLVSASAGSGKTAVLVERVIQKVIKYHVDIDRLLVVTFTNASAAELKERLLKAIYEALDKDSSNVFLKRQISNINKASITTIHSFCLEMIRSHFQILNIDPNFKICDEATSTILKNNAMTEVLENRYQEEKQDDSVSLYHVLELFSGKDESFVEYMLSMYSYIQSFSYPFEWLKNNIEKYNLDTEIDLYETEFGRQIYEEAIKSLDILLKRTISFRKTLEGKEDFVKFVEMFDQDITMLASCLAASEHSWDKFYELLSQIEFSKAPSYKGENLSLKETVSHFRTMILKNGVKELKKSIYASSKDILKDNKIAFGYLQYIESFLIEFDQHYQLQKEKMGVIDFNDIEHLALQLLLSKNEEGNYKVTEVARSLQEKFVEVYTDEYQDTSFVQEAILEAVSGSKNRFMVGDIKQSIYRFRQAMPQIFNQKYEEYELVQKKEQEVENQNCKVILAKNFRSRKNVVQSINYLFERIMSKSNGDCDYQNHEALAFGATYYQDSETNDYTTKINIIDLKKQDNEEEESEASKYIDELKDFEIEAIYIAKEIKELMKSFRVYDSKKEVFRNICYQDIVIILRNIKDKGTMLEKVLKKYHIPVYSDATVSLFEAEEIRLILSFLRVIDNPLQDIHLVSIMYSVIGKFTLDELLQIRNFDRYGPMYRVIFTAKEALEQKEKEKIVTEEESLLLDKITNFIAILQQYQSLAKVKKVSELLVHVYQNTNIYLQYLLDEMSSMRRANLNLLIEFAVSLENQTNGTLSGYIAYIDHLMKKNNSMTSAKILGENEDVVRIMTIHKSKGLEFPVVILCDSARKYHMQDVNAQMTMHHELGIGMNIVNDNYHIMYPSSIKQAIKNKLIKETKSEELRMLYVALTRAKEKLIIFATSKDYERQKSSQFIMYDQEGKIEEAVIEKNSSYFDNLLMTLDHYQVEEGIFDIQIYPAKEEMLHHVLEELEDSSEKLDIAKEIQVLKEKHPVTMSDVTKLKEKVANQLSYPYPYIEDTITPQRISVSELKRKDQQDMIWSKEEEKTHNYKMPSVLEREEHYTSVRKGILVHFILQHLDFQSINTTKDLQQYLEELIVKKVISQEDQKQIHIESIIRFLHSKIGKELKKAKVIQREQEFILKEKDGNRMIQGVIDLYYYLEDGTITLVDFKTDHLLEEKVYLQRYQKQLMIYQEALERLTGCKVSHTYLYSFELNQEIEIHGGEKI